MESEKLKEIKKALECCANLNGQSRCNDCPILAKCFEDENFMPRLVLTLINELESENERYKQSCGAIGQNSLIIINQLKERIAELESENERLRNAKVVFETVDYCAEDLRKAQEDIKPFNIFGAEKTKIEAIERLLLYLIEESACDTCGRCVYCNLTEDDDAPICKEFPEQGHKACMRGMLEYYHKQIEAEEK